MSIPVSGSGPQRTRAEQETRRGLTAAQKRSAEQAREAASSTKDSEVQAPGGQLGDQLARSDNFASSGLGAARAKSRKKLSAVKDHSAKSFAAKAADFTGADALEALKQRIDGLTVSSGPFESDSSVHALEGRTSTEALDQSRPELELARAEARLFEAFQHVSNPPFNQDELNRLDADYGRLFRDFREAPAKTLTAWRMLVEGIPRALQPGADLAEAFAGNATGMGYGCYPKDFPTPDWREMSGKEAFNQMHRDFLTAQGLEDEVRKIINERWPGGQRLQDHHLSGNGGPEIVKKYEQFRELLGLMRAYQDRAGAAMEYLEKTGRWQEMRHE